MELDSVGIGRGVFTGAASDSDSVEVIMIRIRATRVTIRIAGTVAVDITPVVITDVTAVPRWTCWSTKPIPRDVRVGCNKIYGIARVPGLNEVKARFESQLFRAIAVL